MKNVKSVTLSLMTCLALLLTGCDKKESGSFLENIVGNSDIESVKNATLPQYSESLTVGKAFDNWKGCSNPTWEVETTDRGEKLVKFSCDVDMKNVKPYCVDFDRYGPEVAAAECKANKDAMQHLTQVKSAFIFSLSADGTSFTPSNFTKIFIFNDGKKGISDLSSLGSSFLDSELAKVYKNEPANEIVLSAYYEERE